MHFYRHRLIDALLPIVVAIAVLSSILIPPNTAAATAEPHRIEVLYTSTMINDGSEPSKARVVIPRLASSGYQEVLIEDIQIDAPGQKYASAPITDELGRPAIEYRFPSLAPNVKVTIMRRYILELRSDPARGIAMSDPVDPRFLAPEPTIESDHPEFIKLAEELKGLDFESAVTKLSKMVRRRLTYDLNSPARNTTALTGLRQGSGVCTEFAAMTAAVARAAGIPARLVTGRKVSGFMPTSDKNPRHQWVELYYPDYGWVPLDTTFGYGIWHHYTDRYEEPDSIAIKAYFTGGKIRFVGSVSVDVTVVE